MWSSDGMTAEVAHKWTLRATCRRMWHTKWQFREMNIGGSALQGYYIGIARDHIPNLFSHLRVAILKNFCVDERSLHLFFCLFSTGYARRKGDCALNVPWRRRQRYELSWYGDARRRTTYLP